MIGEIYAKRFNTSDVLINFSLKHQGSCHTHKSEHNFESTNHPTYNICLEP